MSSTLGGAWGGVGVGWVWGTDGQSESSKAWTPLPTCHTAAACSPECGSSWMAA